MREFTLDGHVYKAVRAFRGYRDDASSTRLLVASELNRERSAILRQPSTGAERRFRDASEAAVLLDDNPSFARHVANGNVIIDDERRQVWLETWVRGVRLKDLLKSGSHQFGLTEFRQLILDVSNALSALRAHDVVHGALSTETLILSEPPAGSLDAIYQFRIVNLSESRVGAGRGTVDDRAALKVLAEAYNSLKAGLDVPLELRRYLLRFRDYLLLAGAGVKAGNALDLLALRRQADERFEVDQSDRGDTAVLSDPFDFLSAEHFGSDRLFHQVFTHAGTWLEELARPGPTLIEGPRGCGKSMALRWLSVKTKLSGSAPVEDLEASEIAGFYVACASEMQSRVSRFETTESAHANRAAIQHYLNMVLLREVTSTLVELARRNVGTWGLTTDAARAIYGFVAAEVKAPNSFAAGVDLWEQTRDLAQAQLSFAHGALEGREIPYRLTVGSFLHDLARTLTESIDFFATRKIAYCLDDYSAHRIPDAVQQVLNEIVFSVRSGNHVFKISAENRGFYPYLPNGGRIDVQREMTRIDVGSAFLESAVGQDSPSRRFAYELLENRLRAASWSGTPGSLLGTSEITNAQFARDARDRRKPLYSGIDVVADLCSGDVAHLLLLYKEIFRAGGVTSTHTEAIPEAVQDRSIRQVSKELLENVRNHVPHGLEMLEFVDQFCQLSRWVMVDGPTILEHGRDEPRKQTRIEVDGLLVPDVGGPVDADSDVFIELLRRAVLIELRAGVARRGDFGKQSQQSVRLMLRRIYLPAYGLSLSKNMAWKWSAGEFANFIDDPASAAAQLQGALSSRASNGVVVDDRLPGME